MAIEILALLAVLGAAAANAAALDKLKAAGATDLDKTFQRGSILRRFLALLGRKP